MAPVATAPNSFLSHSDQIGYSFRGATGGTQHQTFILVKSRHHRHQSWQYHHLRRPPGRRPSGENFLYSPIFANLANHSTSTIQGFMLWAPAIVIQVSPPFSTSTWTPVSCRAFDHLEHEPTHKCFKSLTPLSKRRLNRWETR